MYHELQTVESVKELSDKISIGCTGAIVYVHTGKPQAYEVEFFDLQGNTIDVLTVLEDDIMLLEDCADLLHLKLN